MTMRRFMIGMVGATVLLVGTVGCSSDGGDSSTDTTAFTAPTVTTPTTAPTGTTATTAAPGPEVATPTNPAEVEFADAANEVCAAVNEDIDQAVSEAFADGPPANAALEDAVDAVVTGTRDSADQIEEIDAPASIQDDVDTLLEELRAGADAVEEQGTAFFDDPSDVFTDATETAAALGLGECV
jgi:hypothetical protein